MRRGAHYDVILQFENRRHWGNLLLRRLQVQEETRFQDMVNVSQRHFMGADVMKVFARHYTLQALQAAKRLYERDIELFHYGEDVAFLERVVTGASAESKS